MDNALIRRETGAVNPCYLTIGRDLDLPQVETTHTSGAAQGRSDIDNCTIATTIAITAATAASSQ
jgi:hypothetical protein